MLSSQSGSPSRSVKAPLTYRLFGTKPPSYTKLCNTMSHTTLREVTMGKMVSDDRILTTQALIDERAVSLP